jgi:hypothetical protein
VLTPIYDILGKITSNLITREDALKITRWRAPGVAATGWKALRGVFAV